MVMKKIIKAKVGRSVIGSTSNFLVLVIFGIFMIIKLYWEVI